MLLRGFRSNQPHGPDLVCSAGARPLLIAVGMVFGLPLAGCDSNTSQSAPTITAPSSLAQAPSASSASAATLPAAAPAAVVSAKPEAEASAKSQGAMPAGAASEDMPSLDDFGAAKEIRVSGSTAQGCETKLAKGWLRVLCHDTKNGGKPIDLTVKSGAVDGKTKVTVRKDEVLQLITPVTDGTRLEAELEWSDGKSTLLIDRPSGARDEDVTGSFSGSRSYPLPKEMQNNGKAAIVNGAPELGCLAHTLNDWIMVQCGTQSKMAGKPKAIDVTRGKAEGSTKIWVTEGAIMTLITPFAAGSDIEATFEWTGIGKKTLNLSWPAGEALPIRVGGFDGFADIPSREEFTNAEMVDIEGGLAHHCTSKMTRGWLRVACNATNATGGKPKSIEVIKGAKPEEMRIETRDDAMNLTVKVGAGTDLEALFTWSDKAHKLLVQWPEGEARPAVLGRFQEAK